MQLAELVLLAVGSLVRVLLALAPVGAEGAETPEPPPPPPGAHLLPVEMPTPSLPSALSSTRLFLEIHCASTRFSLPLMTYLMLYVCRVVHTPSRDPSFNGDGGTPAMCSSLTCDNAAV